MFKLKKNELFLALPFRRHSNIEEESRMRQKLSNENRNLLADIDTLRENVEEEQEARAELQRALTKANGEAQNWRARFEGEGMARGEELEEAKKRLASKLQEAEAEMENLQAKCAQLEKSKNRLQVIALLATHFYK